ncbi:MAG TPA: response regulator [Terriglobia bacterium]|nr:response regulator [Terriglobia bacterium]
MAAKDKQLLRRLLATFQVEAQEHINALSAGLVELEKTGSPERRMEIIETVFREAHSLKGAARAVNLAKVETICQSLESAFSGLKSQEVFLSPELFDRLHQMVSAAGAAATADNSLLPEPDEAAKVPPRAPITRAVLAPTESSRGAPTLSVTPARSTAGDERSVSPDTVRVSTLKLDALLRASEELTSTKATAAHRVAQMRDITTKVVLWEKEWRKVRPQARSVQLSLEKEGKANGHATTARGQVKAGPQTGTIMTFLEWNEKALHSIRSQLASIIRDLETDNRALERRANDLLNDARRISMLPFSSLLDVFPKLVRDLCRDCGKDAELTIAGGEIEADRRILEEMKDPLIHLIRNCIAHGIEPPSERERRGKSSRATIAVAISPKGSDKVEIVVSDDGAGIDSRKVAVAAIKLGLVSQGDAQKMDEQGVMSLVFQSGLSTSPIITEVSGRGLGLAIVREKVERVGGTVFVESRLGIGTTFRLLLPLALAAFRGIIIRLGENLFVLPTMYVQRVLRIGWGEIRTVENRETVEVNGRALSLVRLRDVLGLPEAGSAPDRKIKLPLVVLVWAGEQLAFAVDEILNDQEVLVKGLGMQLRQVRNLAGATILGTGKVVPVLNVADLVRFAASAASVRPAPQAEVKPKSVLVAEDSITARTLLKSILESAGYRVKTAVDGAQALDALGSEDFDLLVSDVEMPRMSGFDLTAKIRGDRRLAELPVVLVTALETRQDRERGVDVGANAYIVKSSFEQSDLLEIVERLI